MKRVRASLSSTLLISLVAAGTTWAATFSWRGFTETSSTYLGALLVLGVVVAISGALGRWWRLPGAIVFLLQALVSGMVACAMLTGSPLPFGAAWTELIAAFEEAGASANQYAAPVPNTAPSVAPLLVGGGLACLLLVDLLACTLRRVPLAGLPLLAVYSVPVSLLDVSIAWWIFALSAGGFMAMLFLHESEQVSRWGRALGAPVEREDNFGVRTGAIKASAGTIGAVATALAIAVPLVIPTLDLNVFEFGKGPGGDSEISINNPMVDLQRDLRRGEDVALLRVETDDPTPAYLRISVLNRFSQNEWSSGDRQVPTENVPNGAMPTLEGVLPGIPRTTYQYDVSINDNFDSTWLPTQAPITSIVAPGDWRYDPRTMDFIAGGDDLTTAGIDYTMTGVKLELSAATLALAPPAVNDDTQEFLDLPTGLPDLVRNLAFGVTDEAPTRFEKAQALQKWFREVGGFEYNLKRAPVGNGVDALEAFLDEDGGRVGYCEQFAAAMAVMARVIGIPARVAVGFLDPEQVGQGVFEYSAYDLHAWPELYFPGAGWVRFEPTPSARAGAVPGYSTADIPVGNPSESATGQAPDDVPTRTSDGPSASATPKDDEAAADAGQDGSSFPWGRSLGALLGLLVLAAITLTPRTLRDRAREHRLDGGPEDAWDELRAVATDLRLTWPRSRSPRETRDWLVDQFGAPEDDDTLERPARGPGLAPDAVEALERIVLCLERSRYARTHESEADAGALRADVALCVAALRGGAVRRVRRSADWWPRSILTRDAVGAPRGSGPGSSPDDKVSGGVVEHVG